MLCHKLRILGYNGHIPDVMTYLCYYTIECNRNKKGNARLMHIGPEIGDAKLMIKAYDDKSITVNSETYYDTFLILLDKIYPNWSKAPVLRLTADDFLPVIQEKPQLLILGTGKTQIFPAVEIIQLFNNNKVGLEIMRTDAACRTYNVLAAEGRNVAGLFFI